MSRRPAQKQTRPTKGALALLRSLSDREYGVIMQTASVFDRLVKGEPRTPMSALLSPREYRVHRRHERALFARFPNLDPKKQKAVQS